MTTVETLKPPNNKTAVQVNMSEPESDPEPEEAPETVWQW